jgi:hypothetical protein
LKHNSRFRDFFIQLDFALFWICPVFLQRLLGLSETKASKITKKYRKYWHSPVRWLAHKTWRKERLCERGLVYIGAKDSFFNTGATYRSKTFNGATYTVEGYKRYIGYSHFKRLD